MSTDPIASTPILVEPSELVPETYQHGVVCLGNFDGVHHGHAHLLATARHIATKLQQRSSNPGKRVPVVAISFEPHPTTVLNPSRFSPPLTSYSRKIELLLAGGADQVAHLHSTNTLFELPAKDFFDQVIVGQFRAVGMVEGSNFCFGKNRGGNTTHLAQWCAMQGIMFQEVTLAARRDQVAKTPQLESVTAQAISSSLIRERLLQGDVVHAERLLGRPHSITGVVVEGDKRGRTIGVPTINLAHIAEIIPQNGVYSGRIELAGKLYRVACNIGPNPTFGIDQQKVEAHILDFSGDLYGQRVRVELLQLIRPVKKFSGLEELKAQLARDIAQARASVSLEPINESARELARTIAIWCERFALPDGSQVQECELKEGNSLRLISMPPVVSSTQGASAQPPSTVEAQRISASLCRVFPQIRHVEFSEVSDHSA